MKTRHILAVAAVFLLAAIGASPASADDENSDETPSENKDGYLEPYSVGSGTSPNKRTLEEVIAAARKPRTETAPEQTINPPNAVSPSYDPRDPENLATEPPPLTKDLRK